ncbi:MAG: hypothetical protein M1839_004862 [Geoglossum umbratile]|nr:MAG: hypothetical protein M1839_004862 [Geoglossum umbratile]
MGNLRASRASLSSMHVRPATIHKSPVFGPTRLRRFHLPVWEPGSGPIDPEPVDDTKNFDVLVPDVNSLKLHGGISKMLGFEYLSRVPEPPEPQKPLSEIIGFLYGRHRPFFSLATTLQDRGHPRYVHFLFDSSSPFTYLSYEACDHFFGNDIRPLQSRAHLNGRLTMIHPAPVASHLKDVNLLGADFCALHGVRAEISYGTSKAKLVFP